MTILDRRGFLAAMGALAVSPVTRAQSGRFAVDVKTLVYSSPSGRDLLLDLYLPQGVGGKAPVIVFLHGGGWSGGTRTTGPDFKRFFAQDGFAMASIEYRLTPSIAFPSNVEDVKTAVRWLRANANAYGLDAQRIGFWGTSAGATLACLAALSPGEMFEGQGNLDQSSAVQCVLDAYGPTFFTLMDLETEEEKVTLQPIAPALANAPAMVGGIVVGQGVTAQGPTAVDRGGRGRRGPGRGPVPVPHDDPYSAESQFVGGPIQTVPDKVKSASPLAYAAKGAPPILNHARTCG